MSLVTTTAAAPSQLIGWGYEGRSVEDLVEDARRRGVTVVADVRLNAVSRRKGFSKRALGERLAASGIEYLHLRDLGNPRENRAGFAEIATAAGRQARDTYRRDVLGTEAARVSLARLASGGPAIVLCFEAHEECCHRQLVLDAVQQLQTSEEGGGGA